MCVVCVCACVRAVHLSETIFKVERMNCKYERRCVGTHSLSHAAQRCCDSQDIHESSSASHRFNHNSIKTTTLSSKGFLAFFRVKKSWGGAQRCLHLCCQSDGPLLEGSGSPSALGAAPPNPHPQTPCHPSATPSRMRLTAR